MKLELLKDSDAEAICGGNIADGTVIMSIMSALAILVAIYKIYVSSKGKAKIGNDYTFEWS